MEVRSERIVMLAEAYAIYVSCYSIYTLRNTWYLSINFNKFDASYLFFVQFWCSIFEWNLVSNQTLFAVNVRYENCSFDIITYDVDKTDSH